MQKELRMSDTQKIEAKLDAFIADQRRANADLLTKLAHLTNLVESIAPVREQQVKGVNAEPAIKDISGKMVNPMFQDQEKNVGG